MAGSGSMRTVSGWAAAGFAVLAGWTLFGAVDDALRDLHRWTGWTLLAITAVLVLYGARARIPRVTASGFLLLHLHLGWIAALLFAFHAGGAPQSGFALLLWLAYALALVSGAVGYLISRLAPRRQWNWDAMPYGRIRQEAGVVAEQAHATMHEMLAESGNAKLAAFCNHRLLPYFLLPTPMWRHWLGSSRTESELLAQFEDVAYSVKDPHGTAKLESLIREKQTLDRRRAQFWLLRGWLFAHIALASLTLMLVLAHIVLVHSLGE